MLFLHICMTDLIILFLQLLADNVRALADLWIVGDRFLADTIGKLYELRDKTSNQEWLYLFRYFNILDNKPTLSITGLNRWIFPVTDLLNKTMWLPKLLLIVPDQDFINNLTDEGMGAALVIGSSLHYVIKQIDMLIARRRQDLLDKKPGAVFPEGFPKIVWVRMFK